ncbi:hypothetical protein GCM10018952_34080 [Streptosporangium vulgare]
MTVPMTVAMTEVPVPVPVTEVPVGRGLAGAVGAPGGQQQADAHDGDQQAAGQAEPGEDPSPVSAEKALSRRPTTMTPRVWVAVTVAPTTSASRGRPLLPAR